VRTLADRIGEQVVVVGVLRAARERAGEQLLRAGPIVGGEALLRRSDRRIDRLGVPAAHVRVVAAAGGPRRAAEGQNGYDHCMTGEPLHAVLPGLLLTFTLTCAPLDAFPAPGTRSEALADLE